MTFYTCYRLEVQADVTSTQRFSLCSETASAATSLSEKSVNASIAPDDGSASTRALAGSVLNMKLDTPNDAASTTTAAAAQPMDSSSGQAASLSSLEEITPGNLAKRTRRRPASSSTDKQQQQQQQQQCSDSSSNWTTTSTEDGGSERVRFDHHVSFIEADQEAASSASSRGPSRSRKRSQKEVEPEAAVDTQRTLRFLRRFFSRKSIPWDTRGSGEKMTLTKNWEKERLRKEFFELRHTASLSLNPDWIFIRVSMFLSLWVIIIWRLLCVYVLWFCCFFFSKKLALNSKIFFLRARCVTIEYCY